MTALYAVVRMGTDSSGRPILVTAYMAAWWEQVCAVLGFTPTITQGAFMVRVGGGATGSAGVHDGAGCLDLRVWDLTPAQVDQTIRVLREHGAGAWRRNVQHGGFDDPHIHFVLGSDRPLSSGAVRQWAAYVAGRDGLASSGPDYEFRPDPLVLIPPEEDDMPLTDEDAAKVAAALLDGQTVELKRADGTSKEITIRSAIQRILNPDD